MSEEGEKKLISGNIPDGKNRYNYAVFPSGIFSYSGGSLTVTLPHTYALSKVRGTKTPLPMVAVNDNTKNYLTFYNVGGMLRLTVNDIPNDATYLQVDFGGYQVSGDFIIASPNPGNSTISTSTISGSSPANAGDKITITDLEGATSAVINIPLPIGTYGDITVSAWNSSSAKVQDLEFSYEAKRAKGTRITTSLTGESQSIFAGSAITSSTSKEHLESIIRFKFQNGSTTVSNIRFVRFFSGNNKLMATHNNGTDTPNPVTISQSTNMPDNIFVGLRFDATPGDPIIFQLFDKDGKAYSGSIAAPIKEGFRNGGFYDIIVPVHLDEFTANASGKKVCFSPGDYGANNTFSEPFVGIGNSSYYFNESTCQANKTVAGVTWRIPEDGIGDWEMWYIVGLGGSHPESRTMTGNASRYYRVYIDKSVTINSVTSAPTCCLLLPPDDAVLSDAEKTELSNAASSSNPLSNYLKYIGKGFVLLTRTSYYDTSWKTGSYPTAGIYRTRASKRCFTFDTNVAPKEIQGSSSPTNKTSVSTRVRYIHTTYTPPTE